MNRVDSPYRQSLNLDIDVEAGNLRRSSVAVIRNGRAREVTSVTRQALLTTLGRHVARCGRLLLATKPRWLSYGGGSPTMEMDECCVVYGGPANVVNSNNRSSDNMQRYQS
eukprot:m.25016 g.25016  ORF g.25016 m.25016 type:complete len:111 (-) comp14840_c0_seq1:1691-2023(-)